MRRRKEAMNLNFVENLVGLNVYPTVHVACTDTFYRTVQTLSTICVIIYGSNKLNKNLTVLSLELVLSFLLGISSDVKRSSFTCFKLHIAISNLKLK